MLRMGVPVATPISAGDWVAAVVAFMSQRGYRLEFESVIRDRLGASFASSTNSGRAALFLALHAMRQTSPRDEVVIPAYACPSIARAVVKAGLKPVLCDVGPRGSGLHLASLERVLSNRTLAVVTAYLYGYPCDIAPILQLSHSMGAMIIEDAAQAFGAEWNGRPVGTIGDAGIFSFGMSKVLWSISGGLVVTSSTELGSRVNQAFAKLPKIGRLPEAIGVAKLTSLGLLLRSRYLGPLDSLWGAMLRGKDDCNDFEACAGASSHTAVARRLLQRLREITRVRSGNAQYLAEHLVAFDEIVIPEVPPESEPVFLRFPVIARTSELKREILFRVRALGLNASAMYSRSSHEALCTFAVRKSDCPNAEYLSERMLNLPTHPFMRQADLAKIVEVFRSILTQCRTSRTSSLGDRAAAKVGA